MLPSNMGNISVWETNFALELENENRKITQNKIQLGGRKRCNATQPTRVKEKAVHVKRRKQRSKEGMNE